MPKAKTPGKARVPEKISPGRIPQPEELNPALMALMAEDGAAEEKELEEKAATPTTHEGLIQLALEMAAAKEEADRLEAEAKQHKARYNEIRETLLPDAMKALGMVNSKGKGSFTFPGGRIHLESTVYASYSKENEAAFFEWLRQNGASDMIREVVNTQTLSAFVRERRADDLPDPPGISIHEPTKAKLTKVK